MLIKYENYQLKEGIGYPFVDGEYSEVIYDGDESVFDIVDESKIIIKTIDQLLKAGYFDQYSLDYMREIFEGYKCYFIYDEEEEKYCMKILFSDEERNHFQKLFRNILIKATYVEYHNDYNGFKYISLDDPHNPAPDGVVKDYWCYSLGFTKNILESMGENNVTIL
jgi:hypothetical protein